MDHCADIGTQCSMTPISPRHGTPVLSSAAHSRASSVTPRFTFPEARSIRGPTGAVRSGLSFTSQMLAERARLPRVWHSVVGKRRKRMCGITGLFLKNEALHDDLGRLTGLMMREMCDRGPDRAGLAIYGGGNGGETKICAVARGGAGGRD